MSEMFRFALHCNSEVNIVLIYIVINFYSYFAAAEPEHIYKVMYLIGHWIKKIKIKHRFQ